MCYRPSAHAAASRTPKPTRGSHASAQRQRLLTGALTRTPPEGGARSVFAREAAAADVRVNAPVERRSARDEVGWLIVSTKRLGRAAGVVDDLKALIHVALCYAACLLAT